MAPYRWALTLAPMLALACGSATNVEIANRAGGAGTTTIGAGGSTTAADASGVGPSGNGGAPPGNSGNDGARTVDRDAMSNLGDGGDTGDASTTRGLPARTTVIDVMRLANDYFTARWPDPGTNIVTDKTRPSHIWTRAVYYEGLMALYSVDRQAKYATYAVAWGESHGWGLNTGPTTRSADNQCAGQTYLDLYAMQTDAVRVRDIKADIDAIVANPQVNDWTWIDAIQMAMPVYARLGVLYGTSTYFEKMYAMYSHTKKVEGGNGLYNPVDHLWWRDQDFDAPYAEPNGENCYWSRGNGWVYAALARVLDILPATEPHRAEYLADFQAMSASLRPTQRSDGLFNVSLRDATHFGGKELTGTALFTYGMAWGIRKGVLPGADYNPVIVKAWNAMVTDCVHPNGFLGWVQGSGKQPSDGQPLSYDKVPDFEDYGLGCFLLAGSEIARVAP